METRSFEPIDAADLRNISADGHHERNVPEDIPNVPDNIARYAFAAHWVPGQRVVDICCSLGYGTNLLAAAGARQIYGVDISSPVIEEARKKYGSQSIQFLCADASVSLPVSEVDVAVCFEGLEHILKPEAFLGNIVHCLAPDGIALFSTPNADSFPGGHSGNPYHVHEYRLEELSSLLSCYFGKVKMFFQWCLKDPYDFRWNPINLAKALIPVPIKHAFRSRSHNHSPIETNTKRRVPLGIGARYRPFPVTYLSLPGLRFAQPPIWVAVCEQPLQDI